MNTTESVLLAADDSMQAGIAEIKQLRADLSRVTAERDGEFRRSDIELAEAVRKESYLRARVADLQQQLDNLTASVNTNGK